MHDPSASRLASAKLRRLGAGFSPQNSGFNSLLSSYKIHDGQNGFGAVLSQSLSALTLLIIISPMLHTLLPLTHSGI
jgi:hypothetical protein